MKYIAPYFTWFAAVFFELYRKRISLTRSRHLSN